MVGQGCADGGLPGQGVRSWFGPFGYRAAFCLASAMLWEVVRRGGDPIVTKSRLAYLELFVSENKRVGDLMSILAVTIHEPKSN